MAKKTTDPEATRLYDAFQYSVLEQDADITRLTNMRNVLDASADTSAWPTVSKIPLALAWSTTEAAVGPALDYMFPPSKFLQLISNDDVDKDTRDKVEWALYVQLVYNMKMKFECARSIRDSLSVSVGYGIVEPITVTPPASFEVTAGANRTRQMGDGRPVRALRYRYISPGKVMPYPSGTDFNGNNPTPIAFLLDIYDEKGFKDLYSSDPKDGGDILLKGNPDEIIKEARKQKFGTNTTFADFCDDMGGRNQASNDKNRKRGTQTSIPILKCYEDGKHTWLFCGGNRGTNPQIIFEDESYAARRKPLIKWDPWLDSDRWFPMSQPEADMNLNMAKNIWFNAIFDLMTQNLKRPLVFNSEETDGKAASKLLTPRGVVGIPGDVRENAAFLKPPSIDTATMQFGDIIDAEHRRTTGEQDFNRFNSTRGGSMAFQDLVQSSTGRDRLRHAIFQMGGLESVANQTLIYMQTLGAGLDLRFSRPAYRDGEDYIEQFEVTEDDLRHAYGISLDLDSKAKFGAMESQMNLQIYQAKQGNRYVDQYEAAAAHLFTDEVSKNRQLLPREVVQQKQAELEAAELEAVRNQGAQAQPGQQGAAGAAPGALMGGAQ